MVSASILSGGVMVNVGYDLRYEYIDVIFARAEVFKADTIPTGPNEAFLLRLASVTKT